MYAIWITSILFVIIIKGIQVGFCDKGFFLEFWVTGSFLGTLAHIKEICFCRFFLLCKFWPTKAKLLFSWYSVVLKKYFFKVPKIVFDQSNSGAFGLTIPKCITLGYWKYFCVNIFSNIFFKIFFANFWKKYFPKIFSIPKCYDILESSDQMLSHGFYRKWIWWIFFFNIQRGEGPFGSKKK